MGKSSLHNQRKTIKLFSLLLGPINHLRVGTFKGNSQLAGRKIKVPTPGIKYACLKISAFGGHEPTANNTEWEQLSPFVLGANWLHGGG